MPGCEELALSERLIYYWNRPGNRLSTRSSHAARPPCEETISNRIFCYLCAPLHLNHAKVPNGSNVLLCTSFLTLWLGMHGINWKEVGLKLSTTVSNLNITFSSPQSYYPFLLLEIKACEFDRLSFLESYLARFFNTTPETT